MRSFDLRPEAVSMVRELVSTYGHGVAGKGMNDINPIEWKVTPEGMLIRQLQGSIFRYVSRGIIEAREVSGWKPGDFTKYASLGMLYCSAGGWSVTASPFSLAIERGGNGDGVLYYLYDWDTGEGSFRTHGTPEAEKEVLDFLKKHLNS